jgi:flagellar basal body-associated protein FliL
MANKKLILIIILIAIVVVYLIGVLISFAVK